MHDPITETVDRPLRNIGVPQALESGTIVADRYEIVRVLGYGGSAVVYAASDRRLKQKVALKILRPDRLTETAVKRLQREVAIARQMTDPRIIRIFDIAESDEATFISMELFDAPTLRSWMQHDRPSIDDVIRVGSEVLRAISALHAIGIVHRDIKPSNILIGASGEVKLGDFGLALHLDGDESRLTQTSGLVGTLEYLSPEQVLGKTIDRRSDLYSFGVLLFEMLAGRVPFEGTSAIGTVVAHVHRSAPDVRNFRPETPRWLARLIAGLLEKEPSRRFADADAVRWMLERRRVPMRIAVPWLRLTVAAVAIAAVVAITAYAWLSRRFARVVNDGGTTISALDRGGRVLWSMRGVEQSNNVVMLHAKGSPRYVGVIRDRGVREDLAHNHDLLLLDAQSGQVVRRVRLPDWASLFPEFSPQFHVTSIGAVDLEGTGDDAVVATYCHAIYWPSYTVLYDPQAQRVGTLFVGSGQHHYVAAADVNGDGRKDILLAGDNNRMGWSVAVAAIDVRRDMYGGYETASSPDADYTPSGTRALLWYATLPAGHVFRSLSVDGPDKRLAVQYGDGRTQWIGFDGFPLGEYRLPLADRVRDRQAAYQDLRETGRLMAGGFVDEAIDTSRRARMEASRSEDPYLIDWSQRSYAAILIKAGKISEGEREFESAWSSSASPSEVAFDAGRTLHLRGELDRAVAWYNRGLGLAADARSGRGRYEFVEGEVLALGEMGRWDDALRAVSRYQAEFREWPYYVAFRQYIQWRRGEKIDAPVDVSRSTTDLVRYWNLEILHRNGMAPVALLAAIDRERKQSSGDTLLLSLRSEVLTQLGRTAEAYDDARRSYQAAINERASNTEVRAHLDVIAARFIARAEAAGHLQEARDAERQLQVLGVRITTVPQL